MTNEELLIFLESMTPIDSQIDSIKSPAWHAHRKAEKIDDHSLLSQLREIILSHPQKKDAELRRNAYFLLSKLLLKQMDPEFCQFFIHQLDAEKDKYILSAMLTSMAQLQLPTQIQIDPIIRCSRSEKWLIRHSAIQALQSAHTDISREALRYWVSQQDETTCKYELIYAQAALGHIGTPEDISLLEIHTSSRIRDVRDTAAYAIRNIQSKY